MTSTAAPTPAPPRRSRRVIAVSIIVIAALVVAFFLFANLYADWLWYQQLGFSSVLLTQWGARALMFAIGFLGMALPLWVAIQLAYRLRPVYVRLSSQLDRYQEVVEPLRRLAMWGIPVFFGFFAGFATSAQWQTAALWLAGVHTDTTDPQFGMDTGFYLFALPFYSGLVGFASATVLICLLVTALVSYLYGSVRVNQRELRISKSARIQLAVTAGLYLLLQAVSLWLDRYRTMTTAGDNITGPAYTDVHARIPGLTILAIVAVLVAVLFFVTAVIGRWRYPLIATALLVITAIVVGAVYPWVVNTVQVRPNQLAFESEYYQRNIDATKDAFGIDDMQTTDYDAKTTAEAGQLRADADTTASIRIMDPAIINPTVTQLQRYRSYYQFASPLDVDRYKVNGESQDTVVSLRELNPGAIASDTWQNSTLVYTHGYGMVVAKGNERTSDGDPVFIESGIPASGFLSSSDFEPRIYFGQDSPAYSIVGGTGDTAPIELDYPSGTDGSGETKTTFTGDGGPSVGSWFNRLIYALKFQSEQILFSDYLNDNSQILYDRNPVARVQKAAPYLTLDSDPYPSVVDGRIVWIIDGYTTSNAYPYSTATSMSQAIEDANNENPQVALDNINYIRNSVKATVDAYDGKVTLYAWDDSDPLLQAWQNVFPSTLKPISDMSADLMSHVRYPTDLFKVQRAMLGVYHVDDVVSFFQRDNVWATPDDPTVTTRAVNQPPYYLTLQMPGQQESTYSMFTSFIPRASGAAGAGNVLMGYLAVDSDAGSTAGTKSPDYGKLRMLEITADTTIPGPGQIQNTFNSDTSISAQINILKQGQSQVLNGNLLTLPVGGGFLYVQPVFVQASSGTQLPQLQKVLVAFGTKVAFEDTLNEALNSLFGGESGANAGDEQVVPDETGTGAGTGTGTASPGDDQYRAALDAARQAMLDRDAALKAGDWTSYGQADQRLRDAINTLLQAEGSSQ